MDQRTVRKGRSTPKSPIRSHWIWLTAMAALFVIIVAYETREALRQQQQAGASDAGRSTAAQPVSEAQLRARLTEYYRSHELPDGWRVADVDARSPLAATVSIVFSPSVQDSRYGLPAPAQDLAGGTFCPSEDRLWLEIPALELQVALGDKTGAIETRQCTPQ